jgi:hypothetical protein
MTASVSTPETVENNGDGGMDVRTSSDEVVAADNGAKRKI